MTPPATGSGGRWVKVRRRPLLVVAVVAVGAGAGRVPLAWRVARPATQPPPLTTVATVALPGEVSRFDYADLDPVAHRLFVAHMGDGTLLELDTGTNSVLAAVPGLPSVTGVIVVPELRRVYASVAGTGQVVTVDEDTATVLT